jgi:hypothetical protein
MRYHNLISELRWKLNNAKDFNQMRLDIVDTFSSIDEMNIWPHQVLCNESTAAK